MAMTDIDEKRPETTSYGIQRELPEAVHLPGHFYTSPEIFAAEKERIFMTQWLCVGRVEEIGEVGSYFTMRILGEPVVIVRESQNEIAAFSNTCRHRGVEVATGRGVARAFVCPYHAWSYDLHGKLIGSPQMNATNCDLSKAALPRLHCDIWRGFIFINFDADPISLQQSMAVVDAEFGFIKPEDVRLGFMNVIDVAANWKFCIENVLDIYHASVVHLATFGSHIKGDRKNFKFNVFPNGVSSLFFEASPVAPGGKGLFKKLPAFEGRSDGLAVMGYLPPNVRIAARRDQIRFYIMWPQAVDKTRFMIYSLYPEEEVTSADFGERAEKYKGMVDSIVDEDRMLLESLQQGVNSRFYEPGPLSHLEEGIHHLLGNYLEQVGAVPPREPNNR